MVQCQSLFPSLVDPASFDQTLFILLKSCNLPYYVETQYNLCKYFYSELLVLELITL